MPSGHPVRLYYSKRDGRRPHMSMATRETPRPRFAGGRALPLLRAFGCAEGGRPGGVPAALRIKPFKMLDGRPLPERRPPERERTDEVAGKQEAKAQQGQPPPPPERHARG